MPSESSVAEMSLIGIATAQASRRSASNPACLPDRSNRPFSVDDMRCHVHAETLVTQPIGESKSLSDRHGQLSLLALSSEVGPQLALAHNTQCNSATRPSASLRPPPPPS